MIIENIFFKLFGNYDKEKDSNKDAEGKGTLERLNLALARDLDTTVYPKITYLIENVLQPAVCFARYIPFLEKGYGNHTLFLSADIETRRKIQKYLLRFYTIKGTIKGYKILFNLLGFEASITEFWGEFTFDSPVTFDDPERRFDMQCMGCSKYCINLTRIGGGSEEPTDAEVTGILNIISFNEPINARLKCITFDETPIDTGDYSYQDFNPDYW